MKKTQKKTLVLFFIIVEIIIITDLILIKNIFNTDNTQIDFKEWTTKYKGTCFDRTKDDVLQPNCKMKYDGLQFILPQTTIKTNNYGLRDKNYTLEKTNGTIRIIALGDSFTFGLGVEQEDTFPEILEQKLNEEKKEKFEVINFGISGYSAKQELKILNNLGIKFNPDIIIITFFEDDWQDEELFFINLSALEDEVSNTICKENNCSVIEFNKALDEKYNNLNKHMRIDLINESWENLKKSYIEINKITNQTNASIILGYLPIEKQWIERLKNISSELGWNIVDLTDIAKNDEYLLKYDRHFNKKGYEKIAERYQKIIENQIIK